MSYMRPLFVGMGDRLDLKITFLLSKVPRGSVL